MTHVKAFQAGHFSQGTSEPITPDLTHKDTSSSCAECNFIYRCSGCGIQEMKTMGEWNEFTDMPTMIDNGDLPIVIHLQLSNKYQYN